MQLKNYNVYFFLLILIGITVLTFFMLKPFVIPFVLAVILAHSFHPIYAALLKWLKFKGLSSLLTCFLVVLIIIVPLSLVVYAVITELQVVVINFAETKNTVNQLINISNSSVLFKLLGIEGIINQDIVNSTIKSFFQNSLSILGGVYNSLANFIFMAFIMFFSLFFLFIDGKKLVKKIMELSPLKDEYEKILIRKFNAISYGIIIKGTFLIALIQGTVGAILFLATGVPSPILLGILMAIASMFPYVGTGFVWIPVGVIMMITGHFASGLVILLVGALIIASLDNILRPKLVGRDSKMHPLLILLSTLGGIIFFGAAGFIIGPIVMAFFVVLWDIYSLEFKKQLEEYN